MDALVFTNSGESVTQKMFDTKLVKPYGGGKKASWCPNGTVSSTTTTFTSTTLTPTTSTPPSTVVAR
jgi:hypothetical protein